MLVLAHMSHQGSEKWGRWGRIFPDKAKSHGQFGPKKKHEIYRQTDRKMGVIIPRQKSHGSLQTSNLVEHLIYALSWTVLIFKNIFPDNFTFSEP